MRCSSRGWLPGELAPGAGVAVAGPDDALEAVCRARPRGGLVDTQVDVGASDAVCVTAQSGRRGIWGCRRLWGAQRWRTGSQAPREGATRPHRRDRMFSTLLTTEPLQARTALLRELVGDGWLAAPGDMSWALQQAVAAREGPNGWIRRDLGVPSHALGDRAWWDVPPDVVASIPLFVDCSGRGSNVQEIWGDLAELRRLAVYAGGRLRVRHVRVAGALVTTAQERERMRSVLGQAGVAGARLQVEVDAASPPAHHPAGGVPCPWSGSSSLGLDLRLPLDRVSGAGHALGAWTARCVEQHIAFHVSNGGGPDIPDEVFEDLLGLLVAAMLLAQGVVDRDQFDDLVTRRATVQFDGPLLTWHGHVLSASEIQFLRKQLVLGCAPVVSVVPAATEGYVASVPA